MPELRVQQVLLDYKVIRVIPERILWFKGSRERQDLKVPKVLKERFKVRPDLQDFKVLKVHKERLKVLRVQPEPQD
jgi:hypothetical protein